MAELVKMDFSQNQILLNPSLPKVDSEAYLQLGETVFSKYSLKNHVALLTSGSTQQKGFSAKMVFLSEQALKVSAAAVNSHLTVQSEDIWAQALPRFHVGGLGIEVRAALSSSQIARYAPSKWQALSYYEFLRDEKCTLASLVPTQVYDLVQAQLVAPRALRAVVVGGGALSPALWRAGRLLGWPLLPSYGMTETCSQIATANLADLSFEQMPMPQLLSHVHLESLGENRYQVRGQSLLTVYAQIQAGSLKVWDPKTSPETWQIEDHLQLQGDRIEVLGRGDDFIKVSGEALSLQSLRFILEDVLLSLGQAPENFALMSEADPRLGQAVVLVSTSQDQLLWQKIKEEFRQRVLPVAKIREVYYINEIPRSSLGKVLWGELRARLSK